MMKPIFFVLLLALSIFIGCSSADKKPAETAEEAFKKAQEYQADNDPIQAIERYSEVKNRFPYSKLATEAELAIADIHFKEEDYPEAQAAYSVFRDLHPKHDKIAYVINQLGLSYFHQLPDSIDRDLSIAQDAISAFTEVLERFPESSYAKEAGEKRNKCLQMLQEKALYIANFYFIRSKWEAAAKRYQALLEKPSKDSEEISLARLYIANKKLGKEDEANKVLANFKSRFPKSSEISNSEQEIK